MPDQASTPDYVGCCPHCGCEPGHRFGHDDSCRLGCNTDYMGGHAKERDCARTEEVLDNYRLRAVCAEAANEWFREALQRIADFRSEPDDAHSEWGRGYVAGRKYAAGVAVAALADPE